MSDSGVMLGQYEFTPYGMNLVHSGDSKDHLYTGHEWDPAAKLYYAGARYYDPVQCHWREREPNGINGPNMYWYCNCNPTSFSDPDGRNALAVLAVAALAGGVANYIRGGICDGNWWSWSAGGNILLGAGVGAFCAGVGFAAVQLSGATAGGLFAGFVMGGFFGGCLGVASGAFSMCASFASEYQKKAQRERDQLANPAAKLPDYKMNVNMEALVWGPVGSGVGGAIGGLGGPVGIALGGVIGAGLGSLGPCSYTF